MGLFSKIIATIRGDDKNAANWDELSNSLIEADLGAKNSAEIIELAKELAKKAGADPAVALKSVLENWLAPVAHQLVVKDGLRTIVIVGVNGTGKTTSVAKLANLLQSENRRVTLAAADTFRAAAIAQLKTWASRLNLPVAAPKDEVSGADPAAVAFDGAKLALENGSTDYLVDTAGRLHTKNNLMAELEKVIRVLSKVTSVDEILLVVDATTGQNGIAQAKTFTNSLGDGLALTGIILTKTDGSAKGGIALAIERELGIPIKFIGSGEGIADLAPFDAGKYLDSLFA
jgi:fused signal recognition particle receptor